MFGLILGFAIGCSDDKTSAEDPDSASDSDTVDSDTDTTDSGSDAVDCFSLSEEQCAAIDTCYLLSGQLMNVVEDGFCVDWDADFTFLECTDMAVGEPVILYAAPPDDSSVCYAFRSGNIPQQWVYCENVVDDCLDCSSLGPDECAAREDCSSIGGMMMQPTDDGDFCIDWEAEGSVVGCRDEGPCGDAESYAQPPDDPTVCWFFSDTCIPDGWIGCGSGQECE